MRKKLLKKAKKALALGLSLGLMSSTAVFASTIKEPNITETGKGETVDTTEPKAGEITVTGGIVNYVYDVILPTSYKVALDPYQLKSKDDDGTNGLDYKSQIYTEPFLMVNASNIPVQVSIYPSVKPASGSGVNVATAAANVATSGATKDLFMEARPVSAGSINIATASAVSSAATAELNASSAAAASAGATAYVTSGSQYLYNVPATLNSIDSVEAASGVTYVATGYAVSEKVSTGSAIQGLSFVLDAAEYQNLAAASNSSAKLLDGVLTGLKGTENYAGFRLLGKLNPYATWQQNAVEVSVVYTLSGFSNEEYAKVTTPGSTDIADASANLLTASSVTAGAIVATPSESTRSATLTSSGTVTYNVLASDTSETIAAAFIYSGGTWYDMTPHITVASNSGYQTVTISDDSFFTNGTYDIAFTTSNTTNIVYGGQSAGVQLTVSK